LKDQQRQLEGKPTGGVLALQPVLYRFGALFISALDRLFAARLHKLKSILGCSGRLLNDHALNGLFLYRAEYATITSAASPDCRPDRGQTTGLKQVYGRMEG